jgi:O-antigen chain-terminating methyltransferase
VAVLGCGRGGLVADLQRAGVAAVGVDNNVGQLVGTDAGQFVEADLFDWLDEQEDGSLRAVVAAHVVEHLPLDLQVRLVFEARRVVAPGGLLVLETPNTLSLSIGATNFWVEPTHQRPVHPHSRVYLSTSAGFGDVSTRLLHDVGVGLRSTGDDLELVEDLNSLLFGPGDVALIARR